MGFPVFPFRIHDFFLFFQVTMLPLLFKYGASTSVLEQCANELDTAINQHRPSGWSDGTVVIFFWCWDELTQISVRVGGNAGKISIYGACGVYLDLFVPDTAFQTCGN